MKGTGEIDYHIGMDFFRDEDGTLCIKPAKYIAKMMDTYTRLFGAIRKPEIPGFPTSRSSVEDKRVSKS